MPASDPAISRPRLIRDGSSLEADWNEIAQRRGTLSRIKSTSSKASPAGMKQLLAKLEVIEDTGVLEVGINWINANYQRFLFYSVRTMSADRLRDVAPLMLVVDPASRPRLDAGLVAEILGLSPAESQVAVMLAEGQTIGDVAAATNRQVNTVKVFTRPAYRKLGISRLVDLVRLVLSLPDMSPLR